MPLPPGFAQTTGAQSTAGTAVEEVIVTGYRASLEDALEEKRLQNGVIDVIKAEDLADFPDANLAESIQRVPGVSPRRRRRSRHHYSRRESKLHPRAHQRHGSAKRRQRHDQRSRREMLTFDASLSYNYDEHLKLTLEGLNIFDEYNVSTSTRIATARGCTATAAVRSASACITASNSSRAGFALMPRRGPSNFGVTQGQATSLNCTSPIREGLFQPVPSPYQTI